MEIVFDPKKSLKNEVERQLPFEKVSEFVWGTAVIFEDKRFPYPEERFFALGFLNYRIHAVCFTQLDESYIRVISFRKANKREIKHYEEERKKEAANEQKWQHTQA